MPWNKDREKHALTQDGLFSMYLQMETKWKAKKKTSKPGFQNVLFIFLPTEGGNTFLLIDNEEDIFRFIDVFPFIYQHSYVTDETLINTHCEINFR